LEAYALRSLPCQDEAQGHASADERCRRLKQPLNLFDGNHTADPSKEGFAMGGPSLTPGAGFLEVVSSPSLHVKAQTDDYELLWRGNTKLFHELVFEGGANGDEAGGKASEQALNPLIEAGDRGRKIPRERVAVESMNPDWYAGQPSGQAAQGTRLGRVGVEDMRLMGAEEAI